jgi:hypothetical protein
VVGVVAAASTVQAGLLAWVPDDLFLLVGQDLDLPRFENDVIEANA